MPPSDRRSAAAGVGLVAADSRSAATSQPGVAEVPDPRKSSPNSYRMKKSINLWAFPYPQRMSLEECLQLAREAGFDGIELNYDLDNDLSPKSSPEQYRAIRKMAEKIGIAISGLCSFLYWPYSLTDNDPAPQAWFGAGRAYHRGGSRTGDGKRADDRRLDVYSVDS